MKKRQMKVEEREERRKPVKKLPEPVKGVNILKAGEAGSRTFRELLERQAAVSEQVLWIDGGNTAKASGISADNISVARAFTAHQHHTLVHRAVRKAGENDAVFLSVPSRLYAADEVGHWEGIEMLEEAVRELRERAEELEIPVVASVTGETEHAAVLESAAVKEIESKRTSQGRKLSSDGFRTLFYTVPGGVQTTVPYWELSAEVKTSGPY